MTKTTPTFSSIAKIFCNFFGHQLKVSRNVTNHIHEYQCAKCGMEMTDTANGILEKLTPKFKETNEFMSKIHKRRRQKQRVFASAS